MVFILHEMAQYPILTEVFTAHYFMMIPYYLRAITMCSLDQPAD